MYDLAGPLRGAGRQADRAATADAASAARQALARVRKLLSGWLPGMRCDRTRLRQAVREPLPEPLEGERLFCVGWLAWLDGDLAAAAPALAAADERCRAAPAGEPTADLPELEKGLLAARSAYWLARVRLTAGAVDAVAAYEAAMRGLGGSPQATAWFVDLLWRAGRVDRAEQVWKSVRANRRVLACDEGPLLDARAHLRRGELGPAEKLLREAAPTSGVAWVEKHLLLAWALVGLRQGDRAAEALRLAAEGPYPAAALAAWRGRVETRLRGEAAAADIAAAGWREYVEGQRARAEGRRADAIRAYRAALDVAAAAPFARYGLVSLGEEDPAAVVAAAPGLFHAVRARVRHAVERFRRREVGPVELLDALQLARNAGFEAGAPFRPLAAALQRRRPTVADLAAFVAEAGEGAARRNAVRVGLELARGLGAEAIDLLAAWAAQTDDSALRAALGRQILRVGLLGRDRAVIDRTADVLGPDELPALVGALLDKADVPGDHPAARLWRGAGGGEAGEVPAAYRHLALAVRLHRAAARADLGEAARALDDVAGWQAFQGGPPAFVNGALLWLAGRQPAHPVWREQLPRWLRLWDRDRLGPAGAALAAVAGVAGAESAEPPPGAAPGPWLLHQAARALLRDDAVAALAFARRVPDAVTPRLVRRADAQSLARALPDELQAALLTDMVDLLSDLPGGAAILDAAREGDADEVRCRLEALAEAELPARLAHHLALVLWRAARANEARHGAAAARWPAAWRAWLAFLAAEGGPSPEARSALLDHLLGWHRDRVNDLLARSDLEQARAHWDAVQALPAVAPAALAEEIRGRAGRFRDEMATAYLLTTREAMRFGAIPEGWRADYDRGLSQLRRLLSLDRDNVRLLTALVEVCGEWFLDLYHTHDGGRLSDEVARFTPLAVQLARLAEGRPGELAARVALAEFYKFRGFVERDPAARAAIYREALRFNPNNDNVRDLLAEMGETPPPRGREVDDD